MEDGLKVGLPGLGSGLVAEKSLTQQDWERKHITKAKGVGTKRTQGEEETVTPPKIKETNASLSSNVLSFSRTTALTENCLRQVGLKP